MIRVNTVHRFITGSQLRLDAGGFVKAKPDKG
jgi:hypothetical protein